MGYTLSYRTSRAIGADREVAVCRAVEAFNRGRAWILALASEPG